MTGSLPVSTSLQKLAAWLSPAFPVGAFTYSHGLEWAIEVGDVHDAATLHAWLADIAANGAGRNDLILAAAAYRAGNDLAGLAEIADLAHGLASSRERRLEATAQGRAFADTILKTWGAPTLAALLATPACPLPTYALAVGIAARDHDLDLKMTLELLLQAFLANLVSAGVRAVPLGQTDGQRVIRDLAPLIGRIASEALDATLDDIGGAAIAADIAGMRHETQYTRLFRS